MKLCRKSLATIISFKEVVPAKNVYNFPCIVNMMYRDGVDYIRLLFLFEIMITCDDFRLHNQ